MAGEIELLPARNLTNLVGVDSSGLAGRMTVDKLMASLSPGITLGFMGDSFTAPTGASNGIYGFPTQTCVLAGSARFRLVAKGVGGETTTQMLARFKTDIIDTGCQAVVIEGGRNDAGQNVPTATSIANITAMISLARSAGLPAVVMTAPPCASGSSNLAQVLRLTEALNLWIRLAVPRLGALVCDMHAALVDPATGYMAAAYSNGDTTPHPNDLGHLVIAEALAPVLLNRQSTAFSLVDSIGLSDSVLCANPLMAGTIGATRPSGGGWANQTGVVGSVTRSTIAKPSSFVNGQGYQIQVDGTSAIASVTEAAAFNASNFSVGDKLALTFRLEVEDIAGNWRANRSNQSSKTGNIRVNIAQNGAYKTFITQTPALVVPPQWYTWTVDNVTNCAVWYAVDAPVGMNFKAKLGECQVFNLTKLVLDTYL